MIVRGVQVVIGKAGCGLGQNCPCTVVGRADSSGLGHHVSAQIGQGALTGAIAMGHHVAAHGSGQTVSRVADGFAEADLHLRTAS